MYSNQHSFSYLRRYIIISSFINSFIVTNFIINFFVKILETYLKIIVRKFYIFIDTLFHM
ncbi:hypothetical protein EKV42_12285 [Staphylococcus sp. SKL71207]|nr:hypothetical protein DB783_11425 [Staphylococcus capitis]RQX44587.1 hypothetical protein DB790_10405 [Staphylococcus capitis]TQC52764.1 hypothetical protein EKV43_06745 [Staphylococcus sp. SKL71187]TQC57755.1 hypothetical protein EKV48_09395 [Staphylococcus sp. SKL70935]TQC63569.1 hypothetical protein EKV42_12285 [Staphylococcus sp. SKL71207]